MSKRNRSAGHAWERECVEMLREIFPNIVTSRSESRSRDDQKVDLINRDEFSNGKLPYNFQCKTTANTVNYSKLMDEMPEGHNIILHKQTKRSGSRFMLKGRYAVVDIELLITLLKSRHDYIVGYSQGSEHTHSPDTAGAK